MAIIAGGRTWDMKVKVSHLVRTMSDSNANVSYTGVGFQPKAMWFWCTVNVEEYHSVGWSDATSTGSGCVTDYHNYDADSYTYNLNSEQAISLRTGTGTFGGAIKSFDADGFTIGWTMSGNETADAQIGYLAIG